MANIVDKYFNRKKKQIFDYSKLINNYLTYDNNQIWNINSSIDFNELIKKIISIYIDNYYFKSINDFEKYNEYLGDLIKCDNKFKTILVCSFNSISEEFKIGNYKISLYILSIIIYTSIVLDRFTYPYNNYKINTKNILSIVDPMFKNISFVKYNFNSKINKDITSLIRKNDNLESRFFTFLNSLNTDTSKNLYESINNQNKYYKISYKYNIPELREYRPKDVKKYMKRIADDLNCISYELATVAALKSRKLGKDIYLLFPINLEFYEKESEIKKLFKITSNQGIKNIIKFYVDYDDYKKYTGIVRILSNSGFEVVINIEDNREVPYGVFNEIKLAFITNEFLEKNKRNLEAWKNNGVEFVIKEISDSINELQMLGLEEK